MEEAENENVGILVLEPKSLRPFKTKDEYLYAMKEDLAEWFNCLYEDMCISADNFLEFLETGVLLCQHANKVRCFAHEQKCNGDFAVKSNFVRDIQIPQYDVQFKVDIKRGTFLARDNISNFITWTAKMGIPEVLRFETDDLVLRKNERSVILCLLEVARVGAKFGMLAPTIVQMEEEIDNEIETGEPPPQIKTCDMKSLDEMVRELVGRCTCPVQFPIMKVGDGKYKIGDNQTLVFVRILRSHVMIRVGGGWDTLEHYLDRHDPCRCGFQGSRHGAKALFTPRRASQPTVSKSLPSTPKCPRKLSIAVPLSTTHSGSTTRPVGPGMRSMSPGPNSRKLSSTGKGCQFGSNVLSPDISNKQLNFTTGLNTSENIKSSSTSDKQQIISDTGLSLPAKQNISKSGVSNSGSSAKQSQASLTQQMSLNATGSQKTPTSSTAESCSRSSRYSQSPVSRKSASPEPLANDRLTNPSVALPSHTSEHSNSTQSVLATNRCSSPMKQITLSELRSSREGKVAQSQHAQRSSADSTKSQMTYESNDSNFPLDKVNTMSLMEFRSLLNNALSIPNANSDSHYKSFESTASQSSVESGQCKDQSSKNTSSFTKRASSNRVARETKSTSIRLPPGTKIAIGKSVQNSSTDSKSYLNTFGIGYSSVSSNLGTLENGFKSKAMAQSASTASRTITNLPSSNAICKPKTPSSISRTRTKASSISENSKSSENSRSTSHSSLQSYESIDDSQNSLGITTSDHSIQMLTPSSSESDFSFRNDFRKNPDVPVIGYSRSNSYSAFSAGNCCHKDNSINSARASSEPKEIVLSDTQIYGIHGDKALNDGYATFSHDDSFDAIDCHQHHEAENATEISCKKAEEIIKFATSPNDESRSKIQGLTSPRKPSGQQTPSHIPQPITPSMSRKLSLPEPNCSITIDDEHIWDRTPSPRKSIVIARAAHNTGTNKQGSAHAFRKRSTTPGLDLYLSPTIMSPECVRRSMTPGPYLQTLRSNSIKTSRDSLNEAFEQIRDNKLSVNNGEHRRSYTSGQQNKNQFLEQNHLSRRPSKDQGETVVTVNVDRSKNQHAIAIKDETDVKSVAKRPKMLAIVRAENSNAKPQTKHIHNVSKTRSHSVEFQQFVPKLNSKGDNEYTLAVKSCDHNVYDRTQEWVKTAVEQNQVQKKNVLKGCNTRSRRAMTPNSFDMRRDKMADEPRSLEEIKAALQLPINLLNEINLDQLEAPPEDPAMYATMEKLFIELKMQELKNSTNESVSKNDVSKSSRSSRRNNDNSFSADFNKKEKGKSCLTPAKALPTFGQQSALIQNKNDTTNSDITERTLPINISIASNSGSNIVVHQTNSPLQQQIVNSPKAGVLIVAQPSPKILPHHFRSASPRTTLKHAHKLSLRSISQRQILASSMKADTSSSSTISNSMRATIRTQPQRPASTPPRFTKRQSSKSSDDIENEIAMKRKETSIIFKKIKEILKIKPRKDKTEGVKYKTKIPAPKSLASMGKTSSLSNISTVLRSMSVPDEDISENSYVFKDSERNGYPEFVNGALNETISGRSETSGNSFKWNTPLTTGRSSIITESI